MHASFLQAIVDGCDDAIVSKTLDGIVTSWNRGAEVIFGYRADEMIGQPLLRLFPPGREAEEDRVLAKIRAGERVDHFETVRVRKDGTLIDVSVTISPIRDDLGRIVGASKVARDISERRQLALQTQLLGAIVRSSRDAIVSKTVEGMVTSWNHGAEAIFGYTAEEMLGQSITRLIPQELLHEEAAIIERVTRGEVVAPFDTLRLHRSGRYVDVSVCVSPIRDHTGRIVGASKIARDISDQKIAQARAELLSSVFATSAEGIVITDECGVILEVNEAFTDITGYQRNDVLGQSPSLFKSSRQAPEFYEGIAQGLRENGSWKGEAWSRRKDGEPYLGLVSISASLDGAGKVQRYVALCADITLLRNQQEQLDQVTNYDALTGLPNRRLLSDRLRQALSVSRRSETSVAVVYLDLDDFSRINELYGHAIGDRYLMQLATVMKASLREEDTLARIGGDEFAAVLVNVTGSKYLGMLIQRLLGACTTPIEVEGQLIQLSASAGATIAPEDDSEADQLLRHADQAMYAAKQAGKNRHQLFDPIKNAAELQRQLQLDQIQQGIARREFVLHYQPKVNMANGDIIGVEALIRWQHPARGLLYPASFLPLIETHDLSMILQDWVIHQALHEMAEWQAQGCAFPVSVNLSPRQLQDAHFPTRLGAIFAKHPQVGPGDLELEILESSALDELDMVARMMRDCQAMGVRFSVDDFGTGYSSLTYLKRLPAETLKIDQSFVRDMLDDQEDLALVEGIIGLAAVFQRQVIAEGVETVAHGKRLLELGCSLAQGYGIARPMPAQELPLWTQRWREQKSWC